MTDIQTVILALPSVLSVIAVLLGILINNSRLSDLRSHIDNASTTCEILGLRS